MIKKSILFLCLGVAMLQGRSAGIRGLEIFSSYLIGNTYEIRADIYTDPLWTDSVEVAIGWGDGMTDTIMLGEGTSMPGFNVKSYTVTLMHTFAADGNYEVQVSVPYWESSILNITDASTKRAMASAQIVISPFLGPNHFHQYNYSYIAGDVTGDDYSLDLSVTEPDGDSIVIEQQTVSGLDVGTDYHYPSSTFSLGTEYISGTTYHYDNIGMDGFFAVSFITKEYRSGTLIASHTREFAFEYFEGMGLIDLTNGSQNILVFPNPAGNIIYVSSFKNEEFKVTDLNGKLAFTGTTNQAANVSALGAGVYLVRTGNSVVKLVKE